MVLSTWPRVYWRGIPGCSTKGYYQIAYYFLPEGKYLYASKKFKSTEVILSNEDFDNDIVD